MRSVIVARSSEISVSKIRSARSWGLLKKKDRYYRVRDNSVEPKFGVAMSITRRMR